MARRGKKSYLEEFSHATGGRRFKSVADLEQAFNRWMNSMGYDFEAYGKKFSENDFYDGADYTMSLLKKDRDLMMRFGLTEDKMVRSRPDFRDVTDKPYSLSNQFRHYGNQGHNYRQRGDVRKKGVKGAANGFSGKIVLIALVCIGLYSLLGDTVYDFITSGAIFKIILIGLCGLMTIGILKSKKMGWPLPIKLIVIFVFWLVILNYNG